VFLCAQQAAGEFSSASEFPGARHQLFELSARQRTMSAVPRLKRWRQDAGFRRRLVIAFYAALLLVAGVAVVVIVFSVLSSSRPSFSERLAEVGDMLAGGTLALAAIAGLVALQAYGAATGLPRLQLQVRFPFSEVNHPVFLAEMPDSGSTILRARQYKQLDGELLVRNLSGYSARNPAVVVQLNGMSIAPNPLLEGWTTVNAVTTVGTIAMQWDGGPNYSIHGHSVRHIFLVLQGLSGTDFPTGRWSLTIELLAEGYRRVVELPVDFSFDDGSTVGASGEQEPPEWI
jgi:hypothetical protein